MKLKLTTQKSKKVSTGVYIDDRLFNDIKSIAEANGLSVNETMAQLLYKGIEKAKEE
jgi:hypothetical protein